jgi:tRNA1Val (adenine37-N6)-methyltransferase
MKVGMDGVLIAAWTDAFGAKRILDVGTGTGLIALMMAQKNNQAQVDAIEINQDAFDEAKLNAKNSPWNDRIRFELSSFQEFIQEKNQLYDLIISNPPFFANGEKAPVQNRAQARHSDVLPLDILISGATKILNANGKIALVFPAENLPEIEKLSRENKLYISRLCNVQPNPQKPVFRILVELSNSECPKFEENLMIEFEKHHDYTPEYKNLTSEFYLKF